MFKSTTKVIFFIFIFLILVACGSRYDESLGFVESEILQDFPVPENAEITSDRTANNPIVDTFAYYELKNIGGEQGLTSPKRYIEEIETWGWNELKEQRMGAKHVFDKDGKTVWLIIEQDNFSIAVITTD